MSKPFAAAPRRRCASVLALLAALAVPAHAQTSDRWVADETEARATLSKPRGNDRAGAAALACDARKWTLTVTAYNEAAAVAEAEIRVDGRAFAVPATGEAGTLSIAVPHEALEPLMAGLRLEIDLPDALEEAFGDMAFSLRGSRIAMTAVAERCSRRDMAAYRPVTFTPYSSYLNLARELRKGDIDAFALATTARPTLDAAMGEFGEGRRLLFTRLCGSSWYFGASGCNITGFAADAGDVEEAKPAAEDEASADEAVAGVEDEAATVEDEAEAPEPSWRAVYDSENVLLFTDPKSAVEGWPDIVTLPARANGPGRIWRWTGTGYAFHGNLPEDEDDEPLPLRLGQD